MMTFLAYICFTFGLVHVTSASIMFILEDMGKWSKYCLIINIHHHKVTVLIIIFY